MSVRYEVTWEGDHVRHFEAKAIAEDFGRAMRDDPAIKKLELWEVTELRSLLIEENPTVRARQEET